MRKRKETKARSSRACPYCETKCEECDAIRAAFEKDAEALAGDWKRVGDDWRRVYEDLQRAAKKVTERQNQTVSSHTYQKPEIPHEFLFVLVMAALVVLGILLQELL